MSNHSDEYAQLAREFLQITRDRYTHAKQIWADAKETRVYWISLAKKYGLTWQEIGDILGEEADTVRMAAKRREEVQHG